MAFKKCRKYHCPSVEDAGIVTLVHFDHIITEVVEYSKVHIDTPDMSPSQKMKGQENEHDIYMRPHQN